jgi:hypothetical protein
VIGIWLLLPVLLAGALAVLVTARAAGREASRLRDELESWQGLRPALVELRSEAELTAAALRRHARRPR